MDLLFSKYASPFPFLDGMISAGRFFDFVCEFWTMTNEEKNERKTWEFFLHKVFDKSFNEFITEMEQDRENKEMSSDAMSNIVRNSLDILGSFNPEN